MNGKRTINKSSSQFKGLYDMLLWSLTVLRQNEVTISSYFNCKKGTSTGFEPFYDEILMKKSGPSVNNCM